MNGIILKAVSGFYYVESHGTVYECKARGSFRKSEVSPLSGDRVEFELSGENSGIVTEILPRKNFLNRPPIANIDKLFIVSSFSNPAPNTYLIDKLTAIAEINGIEPVIVFNKCDTGDFSEWERIYIHTGFKTFTVSALTGEGTNLIKEELKDGINAFTGNSGVGKSSLLNRILPEISLNTGDISEKLGRGRHTTRVTELISLDYGGYVADTPGFSSLEYTGNVIEFKEKLPTLFPDFGDSIYGCRFTSCTHTGETGCAVAEAVKNGDIEESRLTSYKRLFEEFKDLKPWNARKTK